jgi:hypothetical protein
MADEGASRGARDGHAKQAGTSELSRCTHPQAITVKDVQDRNKGEKDPFHHY